MRTTGSAYRQGAANLYEGLGVLRRGIGDVVDAFSPEEREKRAAAAKEATARAKGASTRADAEDYEFGRTKKADTELDGIDSLLSSKPDIPAPHGLALDDMGVPETVRGPAGEPIGSVGGPTSATSLLTGGAPPTAPKGPALPTNAPLPGTPPAHEAVLRSLGIYGPPGRQAPPLASMPPSIPTPAPPPAMPPGPPVAHPAIGPVVAPPRLDRERELRAREVLAKLQRDPTQLRMVGNDRMALTEREDPAAIAADDLLLGKIASLKPEDQAKAAEGLRTNAGKAKYAQHAQAFGREEAIGRRQAAGAAARTAGAERLQRLKGETTLEATRIRAAAITDAAKARAAGSAGPKGQMTGLQYANAVQTDLDTAVQNTKSRYEKMLDPITGDPRDGVTEEQVQEAEADWQAAQAARREFHTDEAAREYDAGRGGTHFTKPGAFDRLTNAALAAKYKDPKTSEEERRAIQVEAERRRKAAAQPQR